MHPRDTKRTPTHPRYVINIIGCSSTVFAVIGSNEKHTFAALLASRSLLDEHPRNTRDCLRAVVRLKPYWAEGNDSFHWISPDPSCDGTIRGQIPVEAESLDVEESIDIVDESVTAESYDADASMDVDDDYVGLGRAWQRVCGDDVFDSIGMMSAMLEVTE
jgi:hypothetical protein